MKAKESMKIRKEMVDMHNEYLKKLNSAMNNARYVEAAWLCYAIFEQRINRVILKYIEQCPLPEKAKGNPVSISTRIKCIENLIDKNYGGFSDYDKTLMPAIKNWCVERNDLVHGLVCLEKYKQYDVEFQRLATSGHPLVIRLYKEAGSFRDWFMSTDSLPSFPVYKCQCKNKCMKH